MKPKSSAQPTYVSVGTQTDEPSLSSLTERETGQSKEFVGLDEVVQQKVDLWARLCDGDANKSFVGIDGEVGGDAQGGDARSLSNLENRISPARR